jgi:Domain of unknown function (DUF4159)
MRRAVLAALVLTAALVAAADAQPPFGRGMRGRFGIRMATPDDFQGSFNFCRIAFESNRYGYGGGWSVDYPRADVNLSIRLSELTKMPVSKDDSGNPNHVVIRLTDDELFQCPFVMMTEVGGLYLDDEEVERLRAYLIKGGFLWADDFWGSYAWDAWAEQISRVLPPGQFPMIDLPVDHPLFRTLFELPGMPQIPSINFWAGSGGGTSERGGDSAVPHTRAITDQHGRVMVLITHNTDIGDSWEREADDPNYFYRFSVDGSAVAINVVLYALTH